MEQSSPDEPKSPKTLDAGQPFCRKDKFRRSFDRQSYRRLQRTNSVNYGSKNNITDLKRLFETNVEVKTSNDKRVDRLNLKPCKSNEDVTKGREFEKSIKSESSHVSLTVFEHSSVNAEEINTQSSSFVSSEEIGEVKKKIKPAIPVKSKAAERIAREKSKRSSSKGKEEIKEGFEKVGRSAQIVSKGKEETRREKTTVFFETSDQKEEKKLGFEHPDQIRPKGNPETDTRPLQEESENYQLRTKTLILVKPLTNEEIAQRVSNIEKLQSSLRKSLFKDTPVLPRKNTNSIEDSPIFPRRNSESCEDIETRKVTVPRRNTNSIEDSVNESGKRASFDQKGTVTPIKYFEDNETTFEQKQSTNLGKSKSLEDSECSLDNNFALLSKDTSSGVIKESLVLQTDRADFVEEKKPILLEKSTIEDNPALLRTRKLFEVKDGSIAAEETSVLFKKTGRKDNTSSVSLQQSSVEQEDEDTPHRKISEASSKSLPENFTQERENQVKIKNKFSIAEDTAAFTTRISTSSEENSVPKQKIFIEEDTKKNVASKESPVTSKVIPFLSFPSENSTLRNDDNKDLREEKPYFNTEDKSDSRRQNSSGINSLDLITKNRVLREDASDLIEKKDSRLRKERKKQSTSSGTFFTEKCASTSEDNSISRQKNSPRTNHINLTSEENQIGEPSEEKKSLSEGEASEEKKSGPSEGNTNLNVDERSEGQKSLTESTSVLLRRDSRKRNSSSTKRVSFSPDVEQFPIAAPRKLLTPKTAVEVVTVEVKTVRKESVTPVLVVEDRKKDVNSNYQNSFTLGDSNHSKTVNEDFDHSKEIVSEDSVYVRRTKEDKERFLNTTESFSSDGDRKNLTVEGNSKIFCTSEENLIDRNSSKAILRRPAEERNSDSEDLTDTTLITEQDTTDVVLRRPARKSRTVFNILSQNGEESSVLKRNSKINRRSNPSAIFTKVKAPPKAERIEADLYILSRQSSEDSIDKIQSALDQFIMDDKKEKKRTNSFKKIFKNFSRKDKKKSKKVENEDNAQNESANLVEGPPRMNKELPEVPSEEVVKRYAQMHIDRYNQVRANFEEPKYSEDYVCMDNGGNKYSYINTAEVNKYIDTSSSSNTLDSENLAFRDSDNSSGLEVKNELFFDTYQNVQLVKPKANIPINSERPLPLPYQDDSFEVENANNVSISDRSLSSRSPSLEGSKLKMPVNRDKVDLQPRIRSPIPPSEVSTDKIIATELLKNKKDKRSSPSHQRLEIEIDYPEQNSIPKGKPPISPQSKALLNLEAGEWHRRQREVNAAPTLEWQRKQREGLSPDVEDWAMKQGEELLKKRMSPSVEEWQKKQRERMSPTVEDWQRKMKQGEELQRKRVSPVVQIEDWQSKMRQGEELLRKRVSPGVEEWQTKMKQGEEWQMKQREQMSPGVEDWQRKQREGMRISEEDWRRQRDVKSPPVEDCRRQRGVEDWQHKAGLSLREMKQQNVSQKNNDDFRRQTNWQRDEISLLERKQKETRSPGIEDCNKRRGVEDWRQRDEISLLQRKQPLNEDAMLEEYGTQRDVEGWQQRDEISLLRRKPPPKKDATPVGAEDYGTQHRKENANPPCDVENWQNKQSKQNHEDLQRKQGIWHKINSEKQQVEIIKDFQMRQKDAMVPKQEGFVRVQREDWQSSPRKQNHVEDCQEIDTTETKLKQRAASPTLEEWRRQQKEILAADQRKQISPTPDKQILAEHQKKVNSLLEWQKIHSKHAMDMVDMRNKIAVDQNDYARRLPSEAYIRAPDQSDYAHRQLVEGSKAAFQDQQKRSPSSETNSSIYSSNYGPQMTTNVLVHVDSHSPQNRSVTPVSRSTTPVTMRSPSNVSLQRTPPKHEIRQSVEAFCWKELKKMKEQEDIQMQIQLSNYGYLEDPIISRRSRSVSQEHARNTRRSSSLPREVQRQRRLEDAGVASRTRVEPIYGQNVVYNSNFVRSSPQRNTIGTSTVQRPIFKRGSLSQNYNNAESQALYYKKVGFHSPQNPENPKAWPTKNGYTQSPPQRRLEVKREVSIEDEVFLPETPKEPLYGIKPKEPIYGGKTKEPTREEIFLMNQQRQRQMRELKEPIYDFRPLPNEQLYRQNGQVYVSRQQPIYGSRVMPNISEEGMYAQKPSLQRNNSFTQRYDYPPNEQMYSRNPQEIYGRLGQKPTTVNNKVCDIYGKIHDGQVQKSGVIYGQLQRNTNAPPTQYQSYNQLQNQNFVRGTRLTASVNDMNRYYQQQDPRFRPQQQQQHAPPDRPLPPIPNDRRPRKPNNSDAEGEVQRIFQTKNRIAGK